MCSTYPTTYVAFPTASAGYSSAITLGLLNFCTQPVFTPIAVPTSDLPHLVFDVQSSGAATAAAKSYYAHAPAATSALGGGDPSTCSTNFGTILGDNTGIGSVGISIGGSGGGKQPGDVIDGGDVSSSVVAVTHTSVAVLTTTWAPVFTSVAGDSNQIPLKTPDLGTFGGSGLNQIDTPSSNSETSSNSGSNSNTNSGSNSNANNAGSQNSNTSPTTDKATQPVAGSTPATTVAAANPQGTQNIVVVNSGSSGSSQTSANSGSQPASSNNQASSGSGTNTGASNAGSNTNANANTNSGSGSNANSNTESISGAIVAGLSGGNSGQSSPQQVVAAQPAQSMVQITLAPAQQPVTIGSNVVSIGRAPSSSGIILAGLITIAPGQATVVNGVNVAVATNGVDIIIGGSSTVPITAAGYLSSTAAPVMTVGTAHITANAAGAFVISGQTLSQGATITAGSDTIVLGPTGGVAVVNGETETMSSATIPVTISASVGSAAFVVSTPEATGSSVSSGTLSICSLHAHISKTNFDAIGSTPTATSAKSTSAGSRGSIAVELFLGSTIALSLSSIVFLL